MTLAYQLFSLPDSSDLVVLSLGFLITLYDYSLRPRLQVCVPKIFRED